METKRKSKAPIIIVIILLLAAAGFGYYKFVYQPDQLAQYELVEEKEVETELVGKVEWHGDGSAFYEKIFPAMAENDASYFIISSPNGFMSPPYEIYQTNKTEFSEKSVMATEEVTRKMTEGMLRFLNYSYDSLPTPLYENSNGNYMFGKVGVSSMAQETIEPQFNGSVVEYFKSHKLKLKCDDCKVTQIGVEIDQDNVAYYYFNITANVLTESCTGDMNDLGIFANEGEAKETNISILCHYSDTIKDICVDVMLIE